MPTKRKFYKPNGSYKTYKEQYFLSPIMTVREFFQKEKKMKTYNSKATKWWTVEKQRMLGKLDASYDDPRPVETIMQEKLANAESNSTDDRAMMRAGQILNNAMYAIIMEVNKQIEYGEDKKSVKWIKCKIADFRSILEELRIFAKMPRYYSPAKPWGLDDDEEWPNNETDGSIANALWVVQIVLSDEKDEDVLSDQSNEEDWDVS